MPEQRRRFSAQFKAEAVQMVIETGKPIAEVARDLGIHDGTLGNWVNAWRREHLTPERSSRPAEGTRACLAYPGRGRDGHRCSWVLLTHHHLTPKDECVGERGCCVAGEQVMLWSEVGAISGAARSAGAGWHVSARPFACREEY
jgi:hypothetical protein